MKIPSETIEDKEDFDPTYIFKGKMAKDYGVEAAILIQHFRYSIGHHKKNGTHFHEGRFWAYDSIANLTKIYPFWSTRTLRGIIKTLLDKNVLISGNFNKNKYDRTKWFAFVDEGKFLPVDNSVDNHQNPVDNPVDKNWIKNPSQHKKDLGNQPTLSEKSSETRRNGHLSKMTNGFVKSGKPIPIYSTIDNSSDEVGAANSHSRGSFEKFHLKESSQYRGKSGLRSFSAVLDSQFAGRITNDYKLPNSLRKKIYALGFLDTEIEKEIQNMIKYHETNPQRVSNEHSCVLGWFKNILRKKSHRRP